MGQNGDNWVWLGRSGLGAWALCLGSLRIVCNMRSDAESTPSATATAAAITKARKEPDGITRAGLRNNAEMQAVQLNTVGHIIKTFLISIRSVRCLLLLLAAGRSCTLKCATRITSRYFIFYWIIHKFQSKYIINSVNFLSFPSLRPLCHSNWQKPRVLRHQQKQQPLQWKEQKASNKQINSQ